MSIKNPKTTITGVTGGSIISLASIVDLINNINKIHSNSLLLYIIMIVTGIIIAIISYLVPDAPKVINTVTNEIMNDLDNVDKVATDISNYTKKENITTPLAIDKLPDVIKSIEGLLVITSKYISEQNVKVQQSKEQLSNLISNFANSVQDENPQEPTKPENQEQQPPTQ